MKWADIRPGDMLIGRVTNCGFMVIEVTEYEKKRYCSQRLINYKCFTLLSLWGSNRGTLQNIRLSEEVYVTDNSSSWLHIKVAS